MSIHTLTLKRVSAFVFGCIINCLMMLHAQQEPLFTQYVNTPLTLNPAYAGNRNSLAVDFGVRQQWMGVEGAPKTYSLTAHSPINKSRVSLGGSLMSDQAGPVTTNQLSFAYSYMVRLDERMFLSLGTNAGLNHYNIGLTDVKLLNLNDPNFGFNIENEIKPLWGVGAVIFTPIFYIGLSAPQIFISEFSKTDNESTIYHNDRHFYINAGYLYQINKKQSIKISTFARVIDAKQQVIDLNALMNYNKYLWFGMSYRFNQAVAGMVNYQVNRNWSICYSYDFYTNRTTYFQQGAHEITLSYDCYKFYKKNKYRNFKRKGADKDDEAIRSIRYF